ncbi:MAG: branched-chain amino acid ABC transporter permease [Synergistaceae bacterium]|jgi:branched-chain amino acid transport system permease protein|nr:branched-chain amino acid ABC transporter permease [Synergistaceae bacterium]
MKKLSVSPKLLTIFLLGLFFAIIPFVTQSRYIVAVCINICVFAAFATAWNIIGGYAGQLGLAHAAFFAIGAYSGYLLYLNFKISPWIGMAVGLAISLTASLIIGLVTFRFKGPYFMLSTIAFGKLVEVLLRYKKDITSGANGLIIPVKGNNFSTLIFKNIIYYHYILLCLLMISLLIAWLVERSKIGYYLRVIKIDQDAAESLGIEIKNYKLVAFLISAGVVTVIGTVYAFYLGYIDPSAVGGLDISTKILSIAVIGGLGHLFGPMVGAMILIPLIELANAQIKGGVGMLVYGLALILIMIFRPKGIISYLLDSDGKLKIWSFFKQKA